MKRLVVVIASLITTSSTHPFREIHWDWDRINPASVSFPPTFFWGSSDSAMQTEGVETAHGKTIRNNWTNFEDYLNTKSVFQERVGFACRRWELYKEDIQRMVDCGLNCYRFSIEWTKIEPLEGQFDEDALQHYVDLVQELRANNITPMLVLFHHTYPLWFDAKKGFEYADNNRYFIRYARHVFERLHTLVPFWIILNEPVGYALEAYYRGNYPPGKKSLKLAGRVAKNQLDLHVACARELKEIDPDVQIGLTHIFNPLDVYHKWNPFEWIAIKIFDYVVNDLTIDFFAKGKFKWPLMKKYTNPHAVGSLDFFGINYYTHTMIKQTGLFSMCAANRQNERTIDKPSNGRACKVLYPEGLYRSIKKAARLNKPMFITENGAATNNAPLRTEYIQKHLYVLSKALSQGFDIRGYLFWSLTDTFCWRKGYTNKHGIYAVDFKTQERTFRPSAQAYVDTVKRFRYCV